MSRAGEIVRKLLEDGDPDAFDPKQELLRYADKFTPEQLRVFKRQAIGFIKWVSTDTNYDDFGRPTKIANYDANDLKRIRGAKTSDEVVDVLKNYDSKELSFLSMIRAGYF